MVPEGGLLSRSSGSLVRGGPVKHFDYIHFLCDVFVFWGCLIWMRRRSVSATSQRRVA